MPRSDGAAFGAFIREHREDRGWTQAELHGRICGKKSKSNQIRTSEIERGVRLPLARFLPVFAKVLKVNLQVLKRLYLRDWLFRMEKRVNDEIARVTRRHRKSLPHTRGGEPPAKKS